MKDLPTAHPQHSGPDESRETIPVSVVIPAFNRAHLIGEAIASVQRQQRFVPSEIVVVDDASSDDTAEVAQRLGARVIALSENGGAANARNTAIQAAREPWVAFLDSDDQWLEHHLASVWPEHESGATLLAGAGVSVGAGQPARYTGPGENAVDLTSPVALYPANPFPASGVIASREAVLSAGGFRTDLRYAEDLDLWVRLLDAGRARLLGRVTVLHVRHGGQKSKHDARRTAQYRIATDYDHRPWWNVDVLAAQETFQGWDDLRAALSARQAGPTARQALFLLRNPRRIRALARLLRRRAHSRRFGRLFADDGAPRVAFLPGSAAPRAPRPGDVDLREAPRPLLRLLEDPTARVEPAHARSAGLVLRAAVLLGRLPGAGGKRAVGIDA